MPRKKHGNYDQSTGLPNNDGQAVGSGTYVWFAQQVRYFLPDAQWHLEEAAKQGSDRYKYLAQRMSEAGEQKIVDELHQRRREDAAQQRIQDRKNWIKAMSKQLEEEPIDSHRATFLRREIAKAQRYLDQRS